MGECEFAVGYLHGRVGLVAQLTHGFDDLCDAAAVAGMVVAQTTTVGVEGKCTEGCLQRAVHHESSTITLCAETEVFECDEDRDGEAVVDGGVVDI